MARRTGKSDCLIGVAWVREEKKTPVFCMNAANGELLWTYGKRTERVLGLSVVGNVLLILMDSRELRAISLENAELLKRYKLRGHSWMLPFEGGRVILSTEAGTWILGAAETGKSESSEANRSDTGP